VILALDTTSESGSLALVKSGQLLGEHPMRSPDGFGHVLYAEIELFLAYLNVRLEQIECFAAASGPGSFTGVRVGLAAIKGLAEATGRPAVAVSNLRAMAYYGNASYRAAVLDARRGEVYGAVYSSTLDLIGEETVSTLADWIATLPATNLELITVDFAPFQNMVDSSIPVVTVPHALAGAVGQIASRLFDLGQAVDLAAIDANYVRRSDAEILWKK